MMFNFFRKKKDIVKIKESTTPKVEVFDNILPLLQYFQKETGITFEKQRDIFTNKVILFCKQRNIYSFYELIQTLDIDDILKQEFIDYLTTNETYFYREFKQIEQCVGFAKKENREKENWVLSVCYYIHHPLRQNTAIETLELSLNLIEEIKSTSGIFFPKSWLNNTIGMYSSNEALKILENFNKTHPNLNPQLKLKILQATNDLYTIQKLIKSY